MQAEDGAVDMNMRDFYKALETAKYVEHLGIERYQGRREARAAPSSGDLAV